MPNPFGDLVPALREELSSHKNQAEFAGSDDFVFPTETGAETERNNVRRRVLLRSVERAKENLAKVGRNPLPEGLTPHSLRRTFISLLLAIGREVPYMMRQVGHADPKVTLSIYAQVMYGAEAERERLRHLVAKTDSRSRNQGTNAGPSETGVQLS